MNKVNRIRRKESDYTFDVCDEIGKPFKTRKEFGQKKRHVYNIAKKNGWLDKIKPLTEIAKKQKPPGSWGFIECAAKSLEYNTLEEFNRKAPHVVKVARKNGWFIEITKHMRQGGDFRHIYAFEFDDNHTYIGLTCDINRRVNEHTDKLGAKETSVKKHIINTNSKYVIKQLTTEPIHVTLVGKVESEYMETYKQGGWNLLNKTGGGSIGCRSRKWTHNKLKELVKECVTIDELRKRYPLGYNVARENKWLEEFFGAGCIKRKTDNSYLTYEYCGKRTLLYKRRYHMDKEDSIVYRHIKKMKWDELFDHMDYGYGHFNKMWTYETCKQESLKYKTRTEFSNGNESAYKVALKNGWLDDFYPKRIKTEYR